MPFLLDWREAFDPMTGEKVTYGLNAFNQKKQKYKFVLMVSKPANGAGFHALMPSELDHMRLRKGVVFALRN